MDEFDTNAAVEVIGKMWRALGEQIAAAVPDLVNSGEPLIAIRWATYAEAALWKATGESDSHDVKDVLPPPQTSADPQEAKP